MRSCCRGTKLDVGREKGTGTDTSGAAGGDGASASLYAGIEALESHWQDLSDANKTLYAQMAVLTRCEPALYLLKVLLPGIWRVVSR